MNWQDDVKFPARLKPLPPDYVIVQLDSGHYLWTRGELDEGAISWDRWWVRRCAFLNYAVNLAASLLVARRWS